MELIFFLLGLLFISPVVIIATYRWIFRHRDQVIKTKAYVVRNESRWNSGSTMYHPVVRFKTKDGEIHQYTSMVGTSPPRFREGTFITLYYLQSNPRRYQIKAGMVLYILALVPVVFGVAFCSVGLYIYFSKSSFM